MSDTVPRLATVGLIVERLNVPLHQVQHVLRTRPHIRPLARAGITRLYSHIAIEQVRIELEAIQARHTRRLNNEKGGAA
jgi:hypothetical protein